MRRVLAVPRWAVRREGGGAPVVGVFLLGSVAGLAVLAAWFLAAPLRPDHVVYGRYVEIIAPPLVGLGVVRLWSLPARRLLLELAAGTGVALLACVVATVYAGGLVSRGTAYGTQPVELSTVPGLADARVVAYDLAAHTPVGLYGYQWQNWRAPCCSTHAATRCRARSG